MTKKECCCSGELNGKATMLLMIVFFILSFYGFFRTGVNFIFFNRYPAQGVFSVNIFNNYSFQREEDCQSMYSYSDPGLSQEQQTQQVNNCISAVAESRQNAKINDISLSVLYALLGLGISYLKKKQCSC